LTGFALNAGSPVDHLGDYIEDVAPDDTRFILTNILKMVAEPFLYDSFLARGELHDVTSPSLRFPF